MVHVVMLINIHVHNGVLTVCLYVNAYYAYYIQVNVEVLSKALVINIG